MIHQPLFGKSLVFRTWATVVGIGIDTDSPTWREQANHLDVLRIHEFHKILHDHIHTVLVKVAMVTEREEIEFQTG